MAAGCAVGILGFARVLSWLLKHHAPITIAILTGFMIGSLRKIWMEMALGAGRIPDFGIGHVLLAIGLAFFGFVLVSLLDHMQTGANPLIAPVFGRRSQQATGD